MREEARSVWIARWIEQLAQDVRNAVRGLRRQPGFALLSIVTLGVALGLLTSVFATFSALYLRPWDVTQSGEVFLVTGIGGARRRAGGGLLDREWRRCAADRAAGPTGFAMREYLEVSFEFPYGSNIPRRASLFKQLSSALQAGGWPETTFVGESPMQAQNNRGHMLRTTAAGARRFLPGRGVSENFFDVIGVPLVAGRMPANDEEIVLNRAAAALLWPGEAPLGQSVISELSREDRATRIVVGIAPDLPSREFTRIEPLVYSSPSEFSMIAIVHSRDGRIADRFNELVGRLDPGVTASARPLEDSLDDVLQVPRVGSWVGWAIGGIGLTLAMIGAFGVFVQSVDVRRREIGIRLALGAGGPQVVRLIITKTQGAVAVGIAAGLLMAAIGAFWARSFLYGLSPLDPVAYLQVTALLMASAALATWIPARRATRVNPMETLRAE